jgi:hypothetical protein
MASEDLDVPALARRLGVKETTVHTMLRRARRNREAVERGELAEVPRGDLPVPDRIVAGRHPLWKPSTIAKWERQRPGHGWRAGQKGGHR